LCTTNVSGAEHISMKKVELEISRNWRSKKRAPQASSELLGLNYDKKNRICKK
jgi:hypothetical protein